MTKKVFFSGINNLIYLRKTHKPSTAEIRRLCTNDEIPVNTKLNLLTAT